MVVARVVGATLAYLAALSVGAILLYAVGLALVPGAAQATFGLVSLGVAEGAALAAVLLVWRFVDRCPIRQLGLEPDGEGGRWLRGAGTAAAMMGFIILAWYTLLDGAAWNLNPDPARASLVFVFGWLGFMIQGPAEEILFRGYILENVKAKWGLGWAVSASSLTFGLLHSLNPHFGLLPFVNLLLFGVATALYKVVVDNGQLWGVFGIHTVWNWLQQVVFGLPNSGAGPVADNAVFTISPNTSLPEPIWGGGFGPEGTLGASLVLLALIAAILRRRAKLQKADPGTPAAP
ncbi:MAG: CPBP family intramembrane metalloprotease [Chloroflexota bacterium]|nr:CPBP family intramembrane metalloprotease [Chloroflexota bacterium]